MKLAGIKSLLVWIWLLLPITVVAQFERNGQWCVRVDGTDYSCHNESHTGFNALQKATLENPKSIVVLEPPLFVFKVSAASVAVVDPVADRGAGEIYIFWDRTTSNTNGTFLNDFKTHRVYYGTSPGVYSDIVDLMDTSAPGMNQYRATGLQVGETYFFVVTTVDSEGHESAFSEELAVVALTPDTAPHEWKLITAVPYAIDRPGQYRVANDLRGNIVINANNVELDVAGHAIEGLVIGCVAGFDIHDFNIVTLSGTAIYSSCAPGPGQIHDGHIELRGSNVTGFYANNNFQIYLYDLTVDIVAGTTNARFVRGSASGSKVFDVVVNQKKTLGYTGPFHFLSGWDIGRVTWTIDGNSDQGFFAQGWGEGINWLHDNALNIYSAHARPFNPDGGAHNWQIHHNQLNFFNTESNETSRGVSMRYGSNNHSIGFNRIDATLARNVRCIRFGGNDNSWFGPDPHDVYVYNNYCMTNDTALELYAGGGNGLYSWANHFEGEPAANNSDVTNIHSNNDVFVGNTGRFPANNSNDYPRIDIPNPPTGLRSAVIH